MATVYGCVRPPFSPCPCCREFPFRDALIGSDCNHAYHAVRDALGLLRLESPGSGSTEWNPVTGVVLPGETVVLKPNLVREFRETHDGHGDCLITHGAVIRAVLDYAYLALEGRGRIIIADAPQNDADFLALVQIAGLEEMQQFYRDVLGFQVEIYDLRPERAVKHDGVIVGHERLPGDPAGYVRVDLGDKSAFREIEPLCRHLYGAEYDTKELRRHHTAGRHEYLISGTVLNADCVINIPKLKTHKKTGITAALKNLVGINGNKNWLPHHREGTPKQGGDEFADSRVLRRMERAVVSRFKRVFPRLGRFREILAGPLKAAGKRVFGDTNTDTVRSGNWYGNDTAWRMVLDLNRILMYADRAGEIQSRPMRRTLTIVDAIIAGEGNGPLDATPRALGAIIAGFNSVAVDVCCARLMGFSHEKLPLLRHALAEHELPLIRGGLDGIQVWQSGSHAPCGVTDLPCADPPFAPHFGWRGHIEAD